MNENQWLVKPDEHYYNEIAKHCGPYTVLVDAATSATCIAVHKQLSELLKQRRGLANTEGRSTATVTATLGPADRYLLMDVVLSTMTYALDYPLWLEEEDQANIKKGEMILDKYPVLEQLAPQPCWILHHRQDLERQLIAIIQDCAHSAPGLVACIQEMLEDFEQAAAESPSDG